MTKDEFRKIFNQYFDSIRSYVFYRSGDKELATDVAQDTFMKVWEKQFKIEGKKIVGLLYKIANDIFISKYRKEILAQNYAKTIQLEFQEPSPEQKIYYKELKKNYEKALLELPDKQRIVFLMSRMENLRYHEIAERLNISTKAVEKRMSNALSYLKNKLKTE